ncbi:PREDICTED: uncharacterized protein LOC104786099 [Camelina sativa]|uniref:Uncharacterized protein LOC104786099 n=1 Tax=Camelina sativa TaxID=90675 RepID=A0ABM0Z329_CAMSA|nr:PREDICTED: uncharacterized protein LOC104786099 [Camelina sativa]
MTEMPSYVVENPKFEPYYKPKKQYNNLYSSLLPILLSIFIYILCFHVLDVSPSSVFNDTKILFIISNALIIIIAADYGSFTAKEDHDFYGEYVAAMRNDARENPRPDNVGYGLSLVADIKNRSEKQEEAVGAKDIQIQHRYLPNREGKVPERTVQVVSENQPRNIAIEKYEPVTEPNIHKTATKEETCDSRKLVNPKPYGRSKSDTARGRVSMITKERRQEIKHRPKSYDRSQWDSSKWMVVHKGKKAEEMEKATQKWENVREESEEFSKMSNEELNRRVEDFIQRFNRDIKRQSI